MRKIIIGVMGPGEGATTQDIDRAFKIGCSIAQHDWILLSGGRNLGVMDAVSKGAKSVGGLTLGIIPANDNTQTSDFVDLAIVTGMGSARNYINILSSDVLVACGMGMGTASEVAMALKAKKYVVLLTDNDESKSFFQKIGGDNLKIVVNEKEAIEAVQNFLEKTSA
jgi:uncharacterized protein (TIGR00725 family)